MEYATAIIGLIVYYIINEILEARNERRRLHRGRG